MRWGSLGSIGLIALMACTGPVAAQQTQSRARVASTYQPAPPPNWTGPQVGGFGGGSFGSPFSFVEPGAHLCPATGLGPVTPPCFETPFQFSDHRWSPTFGVFAGYNAQFGNVVAGVEGDAAWKRISTSQTLSVPATAISGPDFVPGPSGPVAGTGTFMRSEAFTGSMTQRWDGSLRLRVGTLVTPWTLAYGTAGGAVGSVCNSFSYAATLTPPVAPVASVPPTPPATTAYGADNWCETRFGYTVGAGVETAIGLGYNSKLRFEYRYTDLGSFSRDVPLAETPCVIPSCTGNAHIDLRAAFHTFRVGLGFGL
jgi:outer membrane immunogenic protein